MGNKQSTSKPEKSDGKPHKKIIEKNHKIFKKKAFKFGFSVGAGQAYDIECNIQFGTASAKQFIFDNMDENLKLVGRNVIKSIQQKAKEKESNLVKEVPEILNKSLDTNDKNDKEMTDEIKEEVNEFVKSTLE